MAAVYRRMKRVFPFVALVVTLGCHTMRFELAPNETAGNVVYERKSFFLWGLTPEQKVDGLSRCPNGVAAIRECTTFTDGLLSLPTLGIWTPVSSWYYCRAPRGAAP
jgi:hypothetical protein